MLLLSPGIYTCQMNTMMWIYWVDRVIRTLITLQHRSIHRTMYIIVIQYIIDHGGSSIDTPTGIRDNRWALV